MLIGSSFHSPCVALASMPCLPQQILKRSPAVLTCPSSCTTGCSGRLVLQHMCTSMRDRDVHCSLRSPTACTFPPTAALQQQLHSSSKGSNVLRHDRCASAKLVCPQQLAVLGLLKAVTLSAPGRFPWSSSLSAAVSSSKLLPAAA